MTPLLLITLALVLLVGFVALTRYETGRGVRFFSERRERFDATVSRVDYILAHVDWGAFVRDELRHLGSRIGHGVAHYTLLAVRFVERQLTHIVRRFRTSPEIDPAPRETAREFVKTLSEFKDTLEATHPEISAPTSATLVSRGPDQSVGDINEK